LEVSNSLIPTQVHEWVTEEGADPLERFVDLQPQLIRVNSKKMMLNSGFLSLLVFEYLGFGFGRNSYDAMCDVLYQVV
jgi:hypothetical protein